MLQNDFDVTRVAKIHIQASSLSAAQCRSCNTCARHVLLCRDYSSAALQLPSIILLHRNMKFQYQRLGGMS